MIEKLNDKEGKRQAVDDYAVVRKMGVGMLADHVDEVGNFGFCGGGFACFGLWAFVEMVVRFTGVGGMEGGIDGWMIYIVDIVRMDFWTWIGLSAQERCPSLLCLFQSRLKARSWGFGELSIRDIIRIQKSAFRVYRLMKLGYRFQPFPKSKQRKFGLNYQGRKKANLLSNPAKSPLPPADPSSLASMACSGFRPP